MRFETEALRDFYGRHINPCMYVCMYNNPSSGARQPIFNRGIKVKNQVLSRNM